MAFLELHGGYFGPVCMILPFVYLLFKLLSSDWLITNNYLLQPEYGLLVASCLYVVIENSLQRIRVET